MGLEGGGWWFLLPFFLSISPFLHHVSLGGIKDLFPTPIFSPLHLNSHQKTLAVVFYFRPWGWQEASTL